MSANNGVRTVRNLPAAEGGRVETGAVRFGDDWPGLFVRGDDCMMLAKSIRRVLESLEPAKALEIAPSVSDFFEIVETIEQHVLVDAAER